MKLPIQTLYELLEFHYDRRGRLYDFAAALPPEELTRSQQCTWGSFLGILVHSLNAEEFWIQHVLQGKPRPTYWRDGGFSDLESVRRLADEVRERTTALVRTLSESDLEREVAHEWSPGNVARFELGGALMHVIMHDNYHRGQALLLAMRNGHEVPDLDYL